MKNNRLQFITELVNNNKISTQEELMALLEQAGVATTQATVSRDIKRLNLVKKSDSAGGRYYTFNNDDNTGDAHTVILLRHAIVEIKTAGNIIVIKCNSGMGNAVCEALDAMELPEMVGSIAGDNTIFIATEDNTKALKLSETISLIY